MSGPLCSQCGYVMKLVHINEEPSYFEGAHFNCTNCEQEAHVRPNGTGTMTLATLHGPSRSAKDSHAAADNWAAERMMFLGMRVAATYITREEYDRLAQEIADKVEHYKAEHQLPLGLWQRVREKLVSATS